MACTIEQQKEIRHKAYKEYIRLQRLLSDGTQSEIAEAGGVALIEQQAEQMRLASKGKLKDAVEVEPIVDNDVADLNYGKVRDSSGRVVDRVVKWTTQGMTHRYVVERKGYQYKTAYVTVNDMNVGDYMYTLGSDKGMNGEITDDHELVKKDMYNNKDNVLEMFDNLVNIGSNSNEEHIQQLRDLLSKIMDPALDVMNEFTVYMNKKAESTGGAVKIFSDSDKLVLDINEANTDGMSPAEAYVHEMVHMAVEYALRYKKGPLSGVIRELQELYEQVSMDITPDDLKADWMTMKQAEELHDYIFMNEKANGLSEFIAHGLTNEKLMQKLKEIKVEQSKDREAKTVWQKVIAGVIKIYDSMKKVLGVDKAKGQFADERLKWIAAKLWEHNNMNKERNDIAHKITKVAEDTRNKLDRKTVDVILGTFRYADKSAKWVVDNTRDKGPLGETVAALVNVPRVGIKYFANPWIDSTTMKARAMMFKQVSDVLDKIGLGGMFAPEGTIQGILSYISDDDPLETLLERAGLVQQNIDRNRENTIKAIGGDMQSVMKGMSTSDKEVLTQVLIDIDAQAIQDDYDITELLYDDKKVVSAIETKYETIDKLVKDKELATYYKSQAKGLGQYMNDGVGRSTLNKHAMDITLANGAPEVAVRVLQLSDDERSAIAKEIDKLATLEAILDMNTELKDRGYELLKNNKEAMNKILMYHSMYITMSEIYVQNNVHGVRPNKGETKDLSMKHKNIIVHMNDEKTRKRLENKGYKYVQDTDTRGYGIYLQNNSAMLNFEKQALAKINEGKKLHNIATMMLTAGDTKEQAEAKIDVEITDKRKEEIERQMESITVPKADGYERIVSKRGKVSYGVVVNKNAMKTIGKQDRTSPLLLASMIAEVEEKEAAGVQNKRVYDIILKDGLNYTERGKLGKNSKEYIEVGPDAIDYDTKYTDRLSKQLWNDMPQNIRQYILERKNGNKYIAVRRDVALMYFGAREPSVLTATVPGMDKTVKQALLSNKTLQKMNIEKGVALLEMAGDIWKTMVQMQKVDVVIKTPKVIRDNIWSNFNYVVSLGQMPHKVLQDQLEMTKATNKYLHDEKEYNTLKHRRNSKERLTKEELKRMYALRESMLSNPVRPLMKIGMFSTILEDSSLKGLKTGGRLDELKSKYEGKLPKYVSALGNGLYITEETGLFRAMAMTVQMSDFIARAGRFHHLLSKGYTEDQAIKIVLDEFVNYNRISGDLLRWINIVGAEQFTQYFFGANKSLLQKLRTQPTAIILMDMLLDAPNPTDALPFNKNFAFNTHGPIDLIWDQNLQRLVPASLIEIAEDIVD